MTISLPGLDQNPGWGILYLGWLYLGVTVYIPYQVRYLNFFLQDISYTCPLYFCDTHQGHNFCLLGSFTDHIPDGSTFLFPFKLLGAYNFSLF